jgi:hypothetical protein
MYIPIRKSQGGGVNIYPLLGKKPGVRRKLSSNLSKVKNKDLTPEISKREMVCVPILYIRPLSMKREVAL